MHRNEETLGVAAVLATSVIFGLSFMFSKQAVTVSSANSLLSWRFSLAFVCLLLLRLAGVFRTAYKGKPVRPLLLLSVVYPILYFIGESNALVSVSSMEAGLFIATMPIVTMILAALLINEKSTWLQKLSVLLSVAGVMLITLAGGSANGRSKLSGYLFLLLAVSAGAFFVILSRYLAAFTSIEKTLFMTGLSALFFTFLALREHSAAGTVRQFLRLPLDHASFFVAILYLGIITSALAFFTQNYAIQTLGATRTASFAPLTTLISMAAGALLLKEPVSPLLIAGAVMIVAGIIGANRRTAVPH